MKFWMTRRMALKVGWKLFWFATGTSHVLLEYDKGTITISGVNAGEETP